MPSERLAGVSILIVEDEALLRKRCASYLEAQGAEVTAVGSRKEAQNALSGLDFDVVLVDVNLPDGKGTDLLRDGSIPASTSAVVMTAEGGVDGAVEAMRLGASDYLAKPFDPAELPVRLARARRVQQGRRVEEFSRSGATAPSGEPFVFGAGLRAVEDMLGRIIAADRQKQTFLPPVLIEGETGTGKTTIARWLHAHGPRSTGPMIEVNCSALPEALAESELFGHERGAFTDARTARIGLMEAAQGGTLFLDELPSLTPALQAKILTAIEDHTIRRVGASKGKQVDVRIVAATNADLRKLVADGKFREDLLHRLDLFRLRLPPLRERGADILPLAGALVTRISRRYGMEPIAIPPEGAERLRAHSWPGNVRELSHEIERALVLEREDGLHFTSLALRQSRPEGPGLLDPGFVFPESGFSLHGAIDELVQRAIRQCGGNVSGAARILGVTRDYVRYRLRDDPDRKSIDGGKPFRAG